MEKVTVQKSYKRSGIVGILGIPGKRKTNNLRIINDLVGFDPDQVHQVFLSASRLAGKVVGDPDQVHQVSANTNPFRYKLGG